MGKRIVLWLCLMLAVACCVQAEVLHVSPDGLSLTQALASCADGDVIELADGVYAEPSEAFPLVVDRTVTLCAAPGASPVIAAPKYVAALRVEANGVTLSGMDIHICRTGIYAVGDDMTIERCTIMLADPAWRTSSCGIWAGGVQRMTLRGCAFTGCSVSLAGPPLSEHSKGLPVLTGLFEVGEDPAYFTTHTIENCTVNGRPLFYAASQTHVDAPQDAGQIICAGCESVTVRDADVSDGSMGMILAYVDEVTLERCRADRCGVFGIYVAKCSGGVITDCVAEETNHGIDVRATGSMLLDGCRADRCDQGLFFSMVHDSVMRGCTVTQTGQGYFMAAGSGNLLEECAAIGCENGYNLQKEDSVTMRGCLAQECTVCGVRLDASPTVFTGNTLLDNWVGVLAYGPVSLCIEDNAFDGNASCGLYLRDIGTGRVADNAFTLCGESAMQQAGNMAQTVFSGNRLEESGI